MKKLFFAAFIIIACWLWIAYLHNNAPERQSKPALEIIHVDRTGREIKHERHANPRPPCVMNANGLPVNTPCVGPERRGE